MPKTVTLRLEDDIYKKIKKHALEDNRPISNYIETATLRYMENTDYVDEFEMEEIENNSELIKSLKEGSKNAKNGEGRFV